MILKLFPDKTNASRSLNPSRSAFPVDAAAARVTIEILEKLTEGIRVKSLNVRLWDGSYWPNHDPKPATLVLNRPGALREMLEGGSELAVAEAYLQEAFEVEGNMVEAFELEDILAAQTKAWTRTWSILSKLRSLPSFKDKKETAATRAARLNGAKHSRHRDEKAIRFHYDVSNEFYALWLDSRMVYSCAYFDHPGVSLEEAQLRKLDLLCRKLALKPGESLLDIGCGWGGLLLYAATQYGVKADGITLSEKQREWAQALIDKNNLQDRVTVRLADYRELKREELYDKVVSVGMVEHVGRDKLAVYFRQAFEHLKPGGLFLNHGIGEGPVPWTTEGENFIERYVFPDTDLPPPSTMLQAAENAGFEIRDVESLREHYAQTLHHWVRRLEDRRDEARHHVDETTYRIWRLYMAGSAHSFDLGYISVYQTLLAKLTPDGKSQATPTRAVWYQDEAIGHNAHAKKSGLR
jgi:cyclopropane-fatty-acyl-phospholipid synthase